MSTEDKLIKRELEEEMKKIEVPSSLYDFAKNIKKEERQRKSTGKISRKRTFQVAAAAVIALGVTAGSAFFNPAVAEMASKIPYLGQVFQTKPVNTMIQDSLEKEGYKNFSFGMTPGEVTSFEIRIQGTEKDADRERDKITAIADKVLKSKGYDKYKIYVSYIPQVTLTKEEKELTKLGENLEATLKKLGYDIVYVSPFNSQIVVGIPKTETSLEEIKKATIQAAKNNGYDKVVSIEIVEEPNNREDIWLRYMRTIYEGMALKKEYHVTGYGYSYKNNKMKMIIKTNLKPSDKEAEETVIKIREEIGKFVESEKPNSRVKEDEYEIIIRDKNGDDFPY
ncbi:DUF4179 domain-containing protein [Mesobacillus selenatarsenatis]|uniref:DUF4179 domain-containing protein n=1 Tax=Mesobacillus selenatarsenatis TaxID=388741 RepID=A0A846TW36_9BACI|nr:DUF4179 domain-containing protein [Mesobacillus selenatarsenatis]NKE06561.1 DUF4179 domain-containing protein [Mesobacillus selenatarsenatis]